MSCSSLGMSVQAVSNVRGKSLRYVKGSVRGVNVNEITLQFRSTTQQARCFQIQVKIRKKARMEVLLLLDRIVDLDAQLGGY